ncbi:unnamed protein product [Dovyalis caffra]|uniref:Uncharacterized protein n=1 Tax=Dovyalis caffra TaxID=77055 RepID=A0AAV1SJ29_9ROSI|nr:unnamed protein product [Dovyalis caffra]
MSNIIFRNSIKDWKHEKFKTTTSGTIVESKNQVLKYMQFQVMIFKEVRENGFEIDSSLKTMSFLIYTSFGIVILKKVQETDFKIDLSSKIKDLNYM